MENITFYSSEVYLSEENSNPDSYIAKFIICDFGRNKNGVALDRSTIETWMQTIKNKPLVGKVKLRYDGTYDFSGHNMKKVQKTDEHGNKYEEIEFDTDAFGSFFDIGIEIFNDKECIVASCEIWKRFSKACEIIIKRIQEGSLHTSWEIAVEKSKQGIVDGLMTKIITAGRFFGHCLLAKNVSPAYNSSGLVEIASTNYDSEFAVALSQDIISQGLDIEKSEVKEEKYLQKEIKTNVTEKIKDVTSTTIVSDKSTSEETEISTLTEYDLRKKIREACRAKLGKWCWIAFHFPIDKEVWLEVDDRESELDFIRMTYTAENDVIVVSEPEDVRLTVSVKSINVTISEYEKTIAEKDELIIKVSSELTNLKSENTELSQYKEKFTQLEQEKVAEELKEKKESLIASVIKSGQISKKEIEDSKEFSEYVDNLDKKSLMAIVGERLSASVDRGNRKNETSSSTTVHVASNLNSEDDTPVDKISIMRNYLKK